VRPASTGRVTPVMCLPASDTRNRAASLTSLASSISTGSRFVSELTAVGNDARNLSNGALGTNGGPLTDAHGRVRSTRGGVIPGLDAAGNAAASVFGPAYPGGGATIGPAITFGYLAGRHAAARPARAA